MTDFSRLGVAAIRDGVANGEFKAVETNGQPIGNIVAPTPYRDVTPGLMAMMDKISDQSKALGQAAEIPAGEGLANGRQGDGGSGCCLGGGVCRHLRSVVVTGRILR